MPLQPPAGSRRDVRFVLSGSAPIKEVDRVLQARGGHQLRGHSHPTDRDRCARRALAAAAHRPRSDLAADIGREGRHPVSSPNPIVGPDPRHRRPGPVGRSDDARFGQSGRHARPRGRRHREVDGSDRSEVDVTLAEPVRAHVVADARQPLRAVGDLRCVFQQTPVGRPSTSTWMGESSPQRSTDNRTTARPERSRPLPCSSAPVRPSGGISGQNGANVEAGQHRFKNRRHVSSGRVDADSETSLED